jgi:amino acid permease
MKTTLSILIVLILAYLIPCYYHMEFNPYKLTEAARYTQIFIAIIGILVSIMVIQLNKKP